MPGENDKMCFSFLLADRKLNMIFHTFLEISDLSMQHKIKATVETMNNEAILTLDVFHFRLLASSSKNSQFVVDYLLSYLTVHILINRTFCKVCFLIYSLRFLICTR